MFQPPLGLFPAGTSGPRQHLTSKSLWKFRCCSSVSFGSKRFQQQRSRGRDVTSKRRLDGGIERWTQKSRGRFHIHQLSSSFGFIIKVISVLCYYLTAASNRKLVQTSGCKVHKTLNFPNELSLGAVIAIFSGIMYFQDKISFSRFNFTSASRSRWSNASCEPYIRLSEPTFGWKRL